jgi:hydroxypyruvate reductase
LADVFRAAVASVAPARVVAGALDRLPPPTRSPHLFALGKAAPAMAAAAEAWLRARGLGVAGGVVAHAGTGGTPGSLAHLRWVAGDHPLPGPGSAAAAGAVAESVARVQPGDEVLVLVSGGTSSVIAAPAPGTEDSDLPGLFARLLASGADVREVNAARRQVLRWGGGRLAEALGAAHVRCVVLSDVPGGGPHEVGSGPCDHPGVATAVAAGNRDALDGAAVAARALGWDAATAAEDLRGEAAECGRRLAAHLAGLAGRDRGPVARCLIWGGETTVRLGPAPGRGGRSQELALAAAAELDGLEAGARVVLLAAGTDGRDGPTDAAGAVVDGTSWGAMAAAQADPAGRLARHDAYPALATIGALLPQEPTDTNVADLVLGVVRPP